MSDDNHRTAGEIAVLQRFPAERRAIEELAMRSEEFCDMCEELADAELGLRAAQVLPLPVRTERIAEWVAAIDRLTGEITRALHDANVIRIGSTHLPRWRR